MPGMLVPIDKDIEFLKASGIKNIVTLTEEPLNPSLKEYGFNEYHFAIDDMSIPTPKSAYVICKSIVDLMENGESVLVHCRAGLGRTGTIIACCLVMMGKSPKQAIVEIRKKNRGYIQTPVQEMFVKHYAEYVSKLNPQDAENNSSQETGKKVSNEQTGVEEINSLVEMENSDTQVREVSSNIGLAVNKEMDVVTKCLNEVPFAVAAGIVNLDDSEMVSYVTVDTHPSEIVAKLANATKDLFEGFYVTQIEKKFNEARGEMIVNHSFKEVVAFSLNLIHFFKRLNSSDRLVICCVTSSEANIGVLITKCREIALQN